MHGEMRLRVLKFTSVGEGTIESLGGVRVRILELCKSYASGAEDLVFSSARKSVYGETESFGGYEQECGVEWEFLEAYEWELSSARLKG